MSGQTGNRIVHGSGSTNLNSKDSSAQLLKL